jgi:Flp pilus assembly protein TadG
MQPPRESRGIASIEMAITLPVLLLLLLAVAELGRAFVQYSTLSNSVRNGVRYVAGRALSGTTGNINLSAALVSQTQNLVVFGTRATGPAPILPGLAPNQVTVARTGPDITVTAVYPYQPMLGASLPTFGNGPRTPLTMNLSVASRMRPL